MRDELGRDFLRGRQATPARQYEESFVRARGLMRSTGVFDLEREPAKVRDHYGPSRYGADCLTARRLIEAGVPFVLIQCFGTRCDWDWHYEAFSHLSKYMLGVFDHVTTATHPEIGRVKDMGSAAVGVALAIAGVTWLVALGERFGFW